MVDVTLASLTDMEDITNLFYEIDHYYYTGQAANRDQIANYVEANIFQPHCSVKIVLARVAGRALGIATFAILYPAPGMTGQLFMKELFVLQEARGMGIGCALLAFLAKYAVDHQCNRLDWTAEVTNPGAVDFYDHLQVPRVVEKVYYRLEGDQLQSFSARPKS